MASTLLINTNSAIIIYYVVGAPPSISSEDVRSAAEGGQFEFQINIVCCLN